MGSVTDRTLELQLLREACRRFFNLCAGRSTQGLVPEENTNQPDRPSGVDWTSLYGGSVLDD